jgi:hypothetical protein
MSDDLTAVVVSQGESTEWDVQYRDSTFEEDEWRTWIHACGDQVLARLHHGLALGGPDEASRAFRVVRKKVTTLTEVVTFGHDPVQWARDYMEREYPLPSPAGPGGRQ